MTSKFLRLFKKNLVHFTPSLPFRLLRKNKQSSNALPFPFTHPGVCYPFFGTAAVFQAIGALRLSSRDTVLCPSYNCGHEVEPILRQNIPVRFYSINRRLEVDLKDLERKIDHLTRAVLITHYFGFSQNLQEIKEICNSYGLYLIEDCAHALFSRNSEDYLGTFGDLSVFSMRKTIPLPNGGALVVNNPSIPLSCRLLTPHPLSTWNKTLDLWQKSMMRTSSSGQYIYSRLCLLLLAPLFLGKRYLERFCVLGPLAWVDPDDERFNFDTEILEWRMAEVGSRIVHNIDVDLVVTRRRENFQFLLHSCRDIKGCRPIYNHLPEGVCPLFFPLLVYNRNEVVWNLYKKGISAGIWWERFHPSVPWDEFPDAVYLKDHVMVLPIHQDLNQNQLQRMADELHRMFPRSVTT